MKILMHICCSNCAILPLQHFLCNGTDVRGFWFNPNIHPYSEYAARLDSVRKLQRIWGFEMEYADEYPLDDFLAAVVGRGADRCLACYTLRLDRTAETARRMNLEGFTTSLFASPYQNFDMIIALGQQTGQRHGIPFYFDDLRKGWGTSRGLSAELGLYRQKYCGCIYSEMERFMRRKK